MWTAIEKPGKRLHLRIWKSVKCQCAVPENIHTPPTEGIVISWGGGGVGGSVRPKNLKKGMKLNWNIPSVGEVHVWIFSGITDFFSGKFCIRLCFRLENGCAALKAQSPLTSGAIWYIKGFPYPVGKFMNTPRPLRNSATAFSCCGLRFWTPNVEHTPEAA